MISLILLAVAGTEMQLKPGKRSNEDVTVMPFLPQTPSIWNQSATVCLGIWLCGSEGRARFIITTVLRNTSEGHYYPAELWRWLALAWSHRDAVCLIHFLLSKAEQKSQKLLGFILALC